MKKRFSHWKPTLATAALMLIAATALVAQPAADNDDNKSIERFTGRAVAQGAATLGTNAVVHIGITNWTSDEDRAALLEVLANEGDRVLARTLFGQDEVGWVKFGTSTSYPLRYARSFDVEGGGRQIVLSTDRPIGVFESMDRLRSVDYVITLLVLNLDKDGKGDGSMAVGTQLRYDPESNQILVEYMDTQPVALTQMVQQKSK